MKEPKTLKELFYSGELNTKRIKAYKMLSQNYTIEDGKCRDIFSHGIEFACDEVKEYSDQQNAELMSEIERWKALYELGKKSISELIKANEKLESVESENAELRERVKELEGLLNHVVYEYEQDEQSFKTILEIKEVLKNG